MVLARAIWDYRSEVRLTVDIAVSIKPYLSPAQDLTMADVSTAGALIRGEFDDLGKGQEVILAIGDLISLVATVAWVQEGSLGLAFHRRMNGFEFDAVMALDAAGRTGGAPARRASTAAQRRLSPPSWPRSAP